MSRFSVNHLTSQNSNLTPAFVLIVGILIAVPISVAISMAVVFTMLKQPAFASALNNGQQTPNTAALANSQLAHSVSANEASCDEPTVAQEEGHVLGASTTTESAPALPKPAHAEPKTMTHNTTTVNKTENNIINDYSKTWNETNTATTSTNVNVHNEVNIETGQGQGGKPGHHDKDKHDGKHNGGNDTPNIDIDFDTDVDVKTVNNNINPDVNVKLDDINVVLPSEEYSHEV